MNIPYRYNPVLRVDLILLRNHVEVVLLALFLTRKHALGTGEHHRTSRCRKLAPPESRSAAPCSLHRWSRPKLLRKYLISMMMVMLVVVSSRSRTRHHDRGDGASGLIPRSRTHHHGRGDDDAHAPMIVMVVRMVMISQPHSPSDRSDDDASCSS